MKRLFFTLFGVVCVAAFALSQDVKVVAKGTGRTTGHIITLSVQNSGKNPANLTLPAGEIPSDGHYQGYIVPDPSHLTVPGNSTRTMDLSGYCTNVWLPAPPQGAVLPSPDRWNTGSPMLPKVQHLVSVVGTMQASGQITTPMSKLPAEERTVLVQQTLWVHTAPADRPYTMMDICNNLRDQHEKKTGVPIGALPSPEKSALALGIAQITDAVARIGQASGLPEFVLPPLPPAASTLRPAPVSTLPAVTNTVQPRGTGRTTGHIADIFVSNPTGYPITVSFGPDPAGAALFIPSSDGQYQPYIVPNIPSVPLDPGESKILPVYGYCTDVHKPPVPAGGSMPPVGDWIGVPAAPGTPAPGGNTVVVPTRTALALPEALRLLDKDQIQLPRFYSISPGSPCADALSKYPVRATVPGTEQPLGMPLNPETYPAASTPLLLDAIRRIAVTYDDIKKQGLITTPFSGNLEKEREAVIQQTFWMYTEALKGGDYKKSNFQDNTIRQFEKNTGKTYSQLPVPQQEQLDKGVDDFWDSFEAVGAEAKVLTRPTPTDVPSVPAENIPLGKPRSTTVPTIGTDTPPVVTDDNVPPPEEDVPACVYDSDVIFNPEYDFAMKISENWDDEEGKKAIIAKVDSLLSRGINSTGESAFEKYNISEHPTSATAFWKINHVGGFGSAYAKRRFKKADGSTEYVSETENLEVSAEGSNEFFMEFQHDPECRSIVLGSSLSRLQAKGNVVDAVAGNDKNSLKVLRFYTWMGKKAIEFLLARGFTKGVGASKPDKIAAFIVFLKEAAPEEFKDMTGEELSDAAGKALEEVFGYLGIDPDAEVPAFLEEKLKLLMRAGEGVDAAFDLMFYSETYVRAFGGMNITVGSKSGTIIAQTRKFYLRKSLEDSKEAVSGTSDECTELLLTDALPNRLSIKTWGLSTMNCKAENNGSASATLESMHLELLLGICICPKLKPLIVKAELNGWYTHAMDQAVAEQMTSDAKKHLQDKIDKGELTEKSTDQDYAKALNEFMEDWAKKHPYGWNDCKKVAPDPQDKK